jgi:photosystem II stability/assembly factor-like uncharacterized protein
MSRFSLFAVALAVLGPVLLAACGGDGTPSEPTDPQTYKTITIASPQDTIVVGQDVYYTAVVTDSSDNEVSNPQLNWESSNPAVATVDNSGRVVGISEGLVTITASGGNATSNAESQLVIQGVGWIGQETPLVNNLNGVFFFDHRRGWAVGDAGRILFTEDAGGTWVEQQSNATDVNLNSVFFVTSDRGWAVGTKGRVIETFDGGENWAPKTPIDTGGGQILNEIRFFNPDVGVLVGNQGLIVTTDDGGDTWERLLPTVTSVDLFSAFATTDILGTGYAWVVGELGTTISSNDTGESWNLVTPTVTSSTLLGVWRRTKTSALAVGTNNVVLKTIPSGDLSEPAAWVLNPPVNQFGNWLDITWPATDAAYVVGINAGSNAAVLKSTDGGISWFEQEMPANVPLAGNELRAVWFVDANSGWAVGRGGLIVHTATGGETP